MVDAISPISATAASEPTKVGTSTSIGSEPDNAWVAARQSQITETANGLIPHADLIVENEEHPQKRHGHAASDDGEEAGEQAEQPALSGESDRIGTRNFDDDTPFGERVAII
ncbi:hypothetical protein [Rhizobium leguminosarum]|uniref:hypothetical protein n=1 Tax=Rhizobium leguminosarum TaxID=384 RepID=UPI0014416E72|nr:hypothetical protein [Rhizobium leguminosarum]NKK68187.1 hypothetical protein [Rhizobium leguminosarum bv. viciae]NKL09809.1 hypothetical protein [Rhizobium leguminosarum bv. viciae]NKL87294.1 hypothetical protein [Rhizobium leguminosarum bv. viciae]NKL95024.1 hypothetical protein [Rhizobium leguminosarum bv. viciae]NKM95906.1 hypothetical protein [Rhizobium leguminosarum bv. viciae]